MATGEPMFDKIERETSPTAMTSGSAPASCRCAMSRAGSSGPGASRATSLSRRHRAAARSQPRAGGRQRAPAPAAVRAEPPARLRLRPSHARDPRGQQRDCDQLRYTREELLSMSVVDMRPVEERAAFVEYLRSGRRLIGSESGWGATVQGRHDHRGRDHQRRRRLRRARVSHRPVPQRHRAQSHLLGAVSRPRRGGRGLGPQVRLPRQHEPRDPHTDERRDRHGRAAARHPLNEEQRSYAAQVARSGEQMLTLINDILDVSKIEAGQLELDVADFDSTRRSSRPARSQV